jgi:GxxExxY protein
MALVHEDKTEIIHKCMFEVQNEVGLGRKEEAYHRACEIWLAAHKIPFQSKPPNDVVLNSKIVHTMYPDLVLWDCTAVELKAVRRAINASDLAQIFDYLKRRQDKLGLVINFGLDRVVSQRVLFELNEPNVKAEWSALCNEEIDKQLVASVKNALDDIVLSHGIGYGEEISKRLLFNALRSQGLTSLSRPIAEDSFRGNKLSESPLDWILIEDSFVLTWSALMNNNQGNTRRGVSFLKALGLKFGVAVNFGKNELQVDGLALSHSRSTKKLPSE